VSARTTPLSGPNHCRPTETAHQPALAGARGSRPQRPEVLALFQRIGEVVTSSAEEVHRACWGQKEKGRALRFMHLRLLSAHGVVAGSWNCLSGRRRLELFLSVTPTATTTILSCIRAWAAQRDIRRVPVLTLWRWVM